MASPLPARAAAAAGAASCDGIEIMSVQSIGMPVLREEDPRLLRGRGRYVDDVRLPREARGHVVRSPHAHARIVSLDAGLARAAPGVLAVLTGDDLKARGLGTLRPLVPRRRRDGRPAFICPQPILAQGCVRYVGDPVAFVVAKTLDQAKTRRSCWWSSTRSCRRR